MHRSIVVKGDRILSQKIGYLINSDSGFREDEIKNMENMTESEFIQYAKQNGIGYNKK